uniref:DAC domain-containing protein n=1 Tax=Ditylenchus dipsaci TaxID=166011 RepID=A0A915D2F0_9BILA
MSSIATSYKKTVEEFLTQMVDSIARMLHNNIGGTIVFNFYHKEPFNDLMLEAMCKEAMGPNPAPINLSLEEIFGYKDHHYHDGAVVINVFDQAFYAASVKFPAEAKGYLIPSPEKLKHLGTRHYSAYCYSFFTKALIVVVSEEKARISVFKQGTFQLGESELYEKLVCAAKDFKNDKENGWISSGQSGYFFMSNTSPSTFLLALSATMKPLWTGSNLCLFKPTRNSI